MSVADKITRLKTARDNIRTALASYDIDASDHGYEDFANDIEGISIFDPDDYAVDVIEVPTGDPIEPDPSEIHTFSNIQTDGTTSSVVNTNIYLFGDDCKYGFEIEADFDNMTDSGTGDYRRIFSCEANSSPYPGLNLTRNKGDNNLATLTLINTNTVEIEFQLLSEHNTVSVKYDAKSGDVVLVANGTTVRDTITPISGFSTYFTLGGQMWSGGTTIATDRCAAIKINSITIKPIKYQMSYGREYKYMSKAETMPQDAGYWDRQDVIEVQLPTTLKRLKDDAFCMDAGESKLERVNLEHITHVGARAFGWCSKMKIFNFENVTSIATNFLVGYGNRSNIVYDVEEILLPKLETVPRLIQANYKLTSIRYPHLRFIDLSGAKTLGTNGQSIIPTDYNDSKIHLTIKLGSDVEVIGDNALSYGPYTAIDGGALNFPKLTSLGNSAFYHSGIQKVINLGSITEIKTNTFREGNSLTFVRIPSTVTTIGSNAFLENHHEMVMVVEAVTPPSTPTGPTVAAIYVPDESVDNYKAASGWSQRASKIHPMSEYTGTD